MGAPVRGRPLVGLRVVIASVALAVLVLGPGCSVRNPLSAIFGTQAGSAAPEGPASEPAAFYTAIDGVTLYAQPQRSSPVVATLPLHQKVRRDATKRGFAHVTVDGSGQAGWVDNGQLIWRLPARATESRGEEAAAPRPAEDSTAEAPPTEARPAEVPPPAPDAPPPSPETQPTAARPPITSPAVFDPF